MAPKPTKPAPSNSSEAGSGIGGFTPVAVKVMLHEPTTLPRHVPAAPVQEPVAAHCPKNAVEAKLPALSET
jgi:hypothetical protein